MEICEAYIYSQQMRNILSRIKPLSQMRNGFIDSDVEKYDFIPFFQFRFVDNYDNIIYCKIKKLIESFEGNLKWTLMSDDPFNCRRLHTIIPLKYAVINVGLGIKKKFEHLKVSPGQIFQDELYGSKIFSETLSRAIKDIPNLIEYLNERII